MGIHHFRGFIKNWIKLTSITFLVFGFDAKVFCFSCCIYDLSHISE